ncbi:MAG: flagellar protein FlaG [Planctomycetes bacterium]|nr:flagellar protein FlaG [Planctomycetota bacterium]
MSLQGVARHPLEGYQAAAAQAAGLQGADLAGPGVPPSASAPGGDAARTVSDTVTISAGAQRVTGIPDEGGSDTSGASDSLRHRGTEEADARPEPRKASGVSGRAIQFSFNQDLGILQARIVNRATEEVIREIPPEARLKFAERFQEFVQSRLRAGQDADEVEEAEAGGALDEEG